MDRPKHEVLKEFTAVLHRRNPMMLSAENPLEYEAEALSVLSRFAEAALQVPDDESEVAEIAVAIVRQALEFWFDSMDGVDPGPVARELLDIYRSSFGQEAGDRVTYGEVG